MQLSRRDLLKLPIRSIYGNLLLLILGAAIAITSAILFVVAVATLYGMGGLVNKALQIFFFGATISGAVLALLAALNLRGRLWSRPARKSVPVSEAM
jgi:hypothetical protein